MERPSAHLGIHHVAIFVPDLDAARAFWVDLMGYHIEWAPDDDNIYLTNGTDNLAFHRSGANTGHPGGVQLDHIGVCVRSKDEVLAWEGYLRHHGVIVAQATRTHRDGATSCYVTDPNDIRVQIIHHPPITESLVRGNLGLT